MVRVILAGPREFLERCRRQAVDLAVIYATPEAHEAVERIQEADAVLIGFSDEKARLILEATCREGVDTVRFVSASSREEYLKWAQYRAVGVLRGREMESIRKYFSEKNLRRKTVERDEYAEARAEEIRRREEERGSVPYRHRVVTFLSRGGAGQSTLIASLAAVVTEKSNLTVCVVDLDFTAPPGDAARLLGFREEKYPDLVSWANFPRERGALRDVVLRFVSKVKPGLYVLPAVERARDRNEVTGEVVARALDVLYRHFDLVAVDAPCHMEESAVAAGLSDEVYVMSTPSLVAIEGLKLFLDHLCRFRGLDRAKVSLVVNRALPGIGYKSSDAAAFIGVPCVSVLAESREAARFFADGKPVACNRLPGEYGKELEKMAGKLFPKEILVEQPGRMWT